LLVGWIGGILGPRPALLFGGGVSALAAIVCAAVYVRTQHVDLKIWERLRARTVQEPTELQDIGSR
jgi:hypothetical protein